MRKFMLTLCVIMSVLCLCACNDTAELDYGDGNNGELISYESHKVSGDEIGLSVVDLEQQPENKVKVYKTEFTADELTIEIKEKKISTFVYIPEEENTPRYPEKVKLPEYSGEMFKAIVINAFIEKYGVLPERSVITEPEFSVKSFSGKLIVNYNIYCTPTADAEGKECFCSAYRVTLTGDLYTYEVE